MQYRILKDFKGSQDGRLTEQFVQGSTRELSDSLATVAVKEGWAAPATQEAPPPESAGFLQETARRVRRALIP